jgi:DNA polymerase-3 subunit delta'
MADPELLPLQADEPHPLPWHADLHASMARRIGEGRFPHASLLTGPAGVGKTQLAIALASLLVCDAPVEQGAGAVACGQCKQCRLFIGEGHPDARLLHPTDQSRFVRIHQVRALASFSMESPQVARRKVALISRADQLNLNAANALLKTLEEPPADTFLILLHRAGQPLLPTIRSRCQALRVEAPDTETGVAWLGDQCPNSSAADRLTALQWAGGAPLEAKRLLEAERIGQRRECLRALQQYLKAANSPSEAVQPFLKMPFSEALDLLQDWAHDLARAAAFPDAVRDEEAATMLRFLAARQHPAHLHQVYEGVREARRGMEYNVNPELELIGLLDQWRALMRRPGVAKRG